LRSKRTGALDDILEELGSQKVPPDFHQTSADSSLFGSQHSEDEDQAPNGELLRQSPSDTVLPRRPPKRQDERRSWKTLRDFVDDQGIENILQTMEDERTSIEVCT